MNYDFSYKRTNYDLSRERNKHEVRFAKCCRGSAGAGRSFNRAPEQDARSGCILLEVAQALDPATHHALMQQIARGLSALKNSRRLRARAGKPARDHALLGPIKRRSGTFRNPQKQAKGSGATIPL